MQMDSYDAEERNCSNSSTLRVVVNTVIQMMIGIVLFVVLNFAINASMDSKIKLHIIFSTLGYLFLMVEALLVFNFFNAWSLFLSKEFQKYVHLTLLILGTIFIIVGFSLIVSYNKDNTKSGHGICGIVAFAFTAISTVNGIGVLFEVSISEIIHKIPIRMMHIVVGCLSLIMGLVTLSIGINHDIFKLYYGGSAMSTCSTVFIAFIMLYSLMSPIDTMRIIKAMR